MILLILYVTFSYLFMGGMYAWSYGKLKSLAFYLAPLSFPFILGGYYQQKNN